MRGPLIRALRNEIGLKDLPYIDVNERGKGMDYIILATNKYLSYWAKYLNLFHRLWFDMNTTSTAQYAAVVPSISCRHAVVIRERTAENDKVKTIRTPSVTNDLSSVCFTLKYKIEIGQINKMTTVVIVIPACTMRIRVLP
jgi:hypothetical protein